MLAYLPTNSERSSGPIELVQWRVLALSALSAMRRARPACHCLPLDTTRLARPPAGAGDHMITRFFFQKKPTMIKQHSTVKQTSRNSQPTSASTLEMLTSTRGAASATTKLTQLPIAPWLAHHLTTLTLANDGRKHSLSTRPNSKPAKADSQWQFSSAAGA